MKKKMVALLLAVMVTSTSLMQVPVVAHAEENQTEVSLLEEEQSETAGAAGDGRSNTGRIRRTGSYNTGRN